MRRNRLNNSRLIRNLEIQGGETARYVPLYAPPIPPSMLLESQICNLDLDFVYRNVTELLPKYVVGPTELRWELSEVKGLNIIVNNFLSRMNKTYITCYIMWSNLVVNGKRFYIVYPII